jgi:hypothetical protein
MAHIFPINQFTPAKHKVHLGMLGVDFPKAGGITRAILVIRIQKTDYVPTAPLKPGIEAGQLPAVFFGDNLDPAVAISPAFQNLQRIVRAAIIHDDDFIHTGFLGNDTLYGPIQKMAIIEIAYQH